jgi:hypothetical protein
MKVVCIDVDGSNLPEQYSELGYSSESIYIKLNQTYTVYAMHLWGSLLMYLVVDDNLLPDWYPSHLFKVTDDKIPFDSWHFNTFEPGPNRTISALWGYEEIVRSPSHFEDLIERNPGSMEIFLKAKAAIDEWA